MDFNIDYEKKLLTLLGFTLSQKDNSNRWLIYNTQNDTVGFIQYKKLKAKDVKRNIPPQYGYHTEINDSQIHFIKNRYENHLFNNYELTYQKDDITNHIDMHLDGLHSINVSSSKYGFLTFLLSKNDLFFKFKRMINNYHIEESIQIQSNPLDKLFSYNLFYIKDNKERNNIVIDIKSDETIKDGYLKINILRFINDYLISNEEHLVKGDIIKAINEQELGLLSFQTLKNLLKEVLPFNTDITTYMYNDINNKNEIIHTMFEENHSLIRKKV